MVFIRDVIQDIKKFNLKDGTGLKKKQSKEDSKGFGTQKTFSENFQRQETDNRFTKQTSFVEIPSNLSTLSAKELKAILEGLGVKSDDCFEKNDLI